MPHNNVLSIYNQYSDYDKEIFKDLLIDIITISEGIKNPNKEIINPIAKDIEPHFLKWVENTLNKLLETEENKESFLNNFKLWLDELFLWDENIWILSLPIYKDESKFNFDLKWKSPKDFIYIRSIFFNLLKDNNYFLSNSGDNNFSFDKGMLDDEIFKELYNPSMEHQKSISWERYYNESMKDLDYHIDTFKTWKVKLKEIKELLHYIENLNTIFFTNWKLIYSWNEVYSPKNNTDRLLFIELIFSKDKWTEFSFKEIIEYLEVPWIDITDKLSKKIYNLRTQLNKEIEEKIKIKKFFKLKKWELESYISI